MTHNIHGTALSIGGKGVLLRGAPGVGKSSLALRLIDQPGFGLGDSLLRARLVSDDQVLVERIGDGVWMTPPVVLAGKLEIRGMGIVELDHRPEAELHMIVDLDPHENLERMPEHIDLKTEILGVWVSFLSLNSADPAALAKIRSALGLRVASPLSQG